MMIDTLEKSQSATQRYLDLFETTTRNLANAKEDQVSAFKAYVERQAAASHAFVEKLLRAKDFQEAFRIQAKHFQSELKAAADDATQNAPIRRVQRCSPPAHSRRPKNSAAKLQGPSRANAS